MENERIIWLKDSLHFKTPDKNKSEVDKLVCEIVKIIKNPIFDDNLLSPEECISKLTSKLENQNFSVIIDLTGNVANELKQQAPTITDLRLSRLRKISPKIDGVGFITTIEKNKINEIKNNIDFSKPLIIDDVGWSGRTIIEFINFLNIDPEKTSLGFLVLNNGFFGPKPAASELLKEKGIKIFFGETVQSPRDDAFHLIDLILNNKNIGDTFGIIIEIQKLREKLMLGNQNNQEIENNISKILENNKDIIFSNLFDSENLDELNIQGKVIAKGGIAKNSFFTTNPPNWIMPSFSKRVLSNNLENNQETLINLLQELSKHSQ